MENVTAQIIFELERYARKDRVTSLSRFFKTGKGEYGEGDHFIGVSVPDQRKIAQKYYAYVTLQDIEELIKSQIHEYRLTALFLMIHLYQKGRGSFSKKGIIDFYLENIDYVNNWDLVDASAYKLLGNYLLDKGREKLYELASSDNLWHQRIAVISTMSFIKNGEFHDTLHLSEMLLNHPHDLIHKAIGWMLREIGKIDQTVELEFLGKNYKKMNRTMLRYAIERFEPELRLSFLNGTFGVAE